jgi:hypothetical protein
MLVPEYGSLHEFATIYSAEDMYDMLEIAAVRAHNQAEAHAEAARKAKQA